MKKNIKDQQLSDPFLFLAQGIGGESNTDEVWEEEPVSAVEFVESKQFLNQKWNGRKGCRPKILDILVHMTDPNIREIMLLLGKGSGKDYISAINHLYGIYKCLCMFNPQSYFGLSPSPIYFVNTARNDTQAKKVFFALFRMLLAECPWFKGKYSEPGLQSVSFIKNIQAISVNSQAYGWLGYNTIQWVGDELAFFLESDNDDESESRAEECWQAAYGSCKTRFPKHYKMIGITTPRYDDDFVMNKFQELKTRKDGYSAQGATWEMNPNMTKADFDPDFKRDYRRTMRDFGAQPQGVLESFWPEPKILEELVSPICKACPVYQNRDKCTDIHACMDYSDCKANPYKGNGEWRDWFAPPKVDRDIEHTMHYDLAKTKDRLGFALGHIIGEMKIEIDANKKQQKIQKGNLLKLDELDDEDKFEIKPIIRIDALGWISTKSKDRDQFMLINGDYDYQKVLDYQPFQLKKRGFNISKITTDQYQSVMFTQALEKNGYDTEIISLDRNDEIPLAAKYAILENRVEFPYCLLLLNEAKYLKHINGKKVDHSKKSSKDVWDALAGTIYNCEMMFNSGGSFVPLNENDED